MAMFSSFGRGRSHRRGRHSMFGSRRGRRRDHFSTTRRDADLDRAMRDASRARDKLTGYLADQETRGQKATQTVEVLGASFLSGYLALRYGNPKLGPIPVNLIAGLALEAAGWMMPRGGQHLRNLGDGVLAGAAAGLGAQYGASAALAASAAPATSGVGNWGLGYGYAAPAYAYPAAYPAVPPAVPAAYGVPMVGDDMAMAWQRGAYG